MLTREVFASSASHPSILDKGGMVLSKPPSFGAPVTRRWAYPLIAIVLGLALPAAAFLWPASAQGHAPTASKVHCLNISANDFADVLGGIDPASVSAGPTLGPEPTDYGRRDCQMLSTFQTTIEVAVWDDPTGAKFTQLFGWALSPPQQVDTSDPNVQAFCYARITTDPMFGEVDVYTCDLRTGGRDLEVQDFDSYPPLQQEQVVALLKAGAARM